MFGGGHISLGAVKRRSSGIARVVSNRASSVVASFVGANGRADDNGEMIEEADDEDREVAGGEGRLSSQHLEGTGSVNLEAKSPKDVFEFEANQTPEADNEDKPQVPEDVEDFTEPKWI